MSQPRLGYCKKNIKKVLCYRCCKVGHYMRDTPDKGQKSKDGSSFLNVIQKNDDS
ncbi:hypothetical protein YC2023_059744 [Brassica napus]